MKTLYYTLIYRFSGSLNDLFLAIICITICNYACRIIQIKPLGNVMSKIKHCCDSMEVIVNTTCDMHGDDCPDKFIIFSEQFNEYGINIYGTPAVSNIKFCPYCGKKLPKSKRKKFYNTMKKLGIDTNEDKIPKKYRHYGWWLK